MPDTYSCPHCQIQLRLTPEMVGQTLRCPGCQATFTAGASAPPPIRHQEVVAERRPPEPRPQGPAGYPPSKPRRRAPDDEQGADWGEEPKVQFSAEEVQAWQSARSGLSLHILAHYLYIGGVALLLVTFIFTLIFAKQIAEAAQGGGGGFGLVLIAILANLVDLAIVGNWILAMVATSYWVLAPSRNGTKGVAIACLVLTSLVLIRMGDLARLLELFSGPRERPGQPPVTSVTPFILLEISRLTLFPFFLRALALAFRQPSLGSMAVILAIVTPCTIGGLFLLSFLLIVTTKSAVVVVIMIILSLLGYLGVLVLGMLALMRGRNILRTQLRRPAS
jgi:hypothetical protein